MPFITEPREHKKLKLNAFFLVSGCSFHCRSLAMHTAKKPEHLAINKHCKSTFFRGLFFCVCFSFKCFLWKFARNFIMIQNCCWACSRGLCTATEQKKMCMHKKKINCQSWSNQSIEHFCFRASLRNDEGLKSKNSKNVSRSQAAPSVEEKYIEIQFWLNWIRDADEKKENETRSPARATPNKETCFISIFHIEIPDRAFCQRIINDCMKRLLEN